MIRCSVLLFSMAAALAAQPRDPRDVLRTWFPDGTGIEIHTQSSGSQQVLSTSGAVMTGSGDIHRAVIGQGKIIFAYDIEARKGQHGTVVLRVKPVDQEWLRKGGWSPAGKAAEGPIPTLSAMRTFPPLRAGDAVEIDILHNPQTNEKIFDVVRISGDPPPPPPRPSGQRGNQFSFQSVRVAVNGKVLHEQGNSWIIGEAVAIQVPQLGKFFLTLSPPASYPFKASGWVDHNVLRFQTGADQVEITGKGNVLQKSDYGTVWVYQMPTEFSEKYQSMRRVLSPKHPDIIYMERTSKGLFTIDTAEDVESLIPKPKRED